MPRRKPQEPEKREPGRPPRDGEGATARIEVRVLPSERERWLAAATKAELSLSDWMRAKLNRAAG